jgi:iron complex outermembrane receptor protein
VNPTHLHVRHFIAAALLAAFASAPLHAQTVTQGRTEKTDADKAVRLQEFEVIEPRTSAQTMAPAESRLNAVQPQSIIGVQTIQNSIAPTADYAMIANLAPSVTNFSTNGPGLNESKPTLRGFGDGNYNVTIDGIPFGDGNDFTHHTTSYFPAKLLGRVTVDRGPGTASTIGMATFGGTMALETKDPRTTESFVPTLSYGSYKTELAHLEFNTGIMPPAKDGSLIGSYQYMTSDGYRTFGTLRRNTYFFKYLQPIGKSTTLSFMGEYNNIKFNNPNRTLTGQDIITLGRNFGQTNDPNDRNGDYYGTNHQEKHTDTEFIALNSDLGSGWKFSDKVYSFDYNNTSHESPNITAGGTVNPATGKVVAGTDLGGQLKVNVVRSYGTYAALSHDGDAGTFKTGVWFDYQHGPRYNYFLDYNVAHAQALGLVAMPGGYLDANHSSSAQGYAWNMHFYTRTWEPYVEYAWHPLPALTLTPGMKYMFVQRDIEAKVNQTKDLLPGYFGTNYSKTMPLVTANYRIMTNWSAYAQYATGFLTPPLAFFQEDHPQNNVIKPQTTTNYQIGTIYKTNRFNADIDGYFVRSHNLPVSTINPDQTGIINANDLITFTAAGSYYYGVEAEGTYYVGGGFSAFVNGSRNYATYEKSKRRIDGVAQSTGGFGFIYDHAGFFTSLMSKYSGPYTTYVGAPNPDQPLPASALTVVQGGYSMFDLSLGYGTKLQRGAFLRSFKARLQINNVFDRNVILLKSPKATAGVLNPLTSTFNPLTPRGYFLTVSSEF